MNSLSGIAGQTFVRLLVAFLSTPGVSSLVRLDTAVDSVAAPLSHALATTLLGVLMLSVANFDFVVRLVHLDGKHEKSTFVGTNYGVLSLSEDLRCYWPLL